MERRQLHGTRDGLWILCRDGVAKVRFDGVDGCGWEHLLLRGFGRWWKNYEQSTSYGEALINHVICAGIHVAFTLMKTAANKCGHHFSFVHLFIG
jgi:hypothetical protein